jgi:predicted DNA-binding transcriptional regulator YafY
MLRDWTEEYSKEDFMTELGISEKTFNLDRRAMEDLFDVEILSIRGIAKKYIYRYADRDMSIDEKPLTQDQVDKIEQAVSIISGISGLTLFEDFNEILDKIRGYKSKKRMIEEVKPFLSFQIDHYFNTNHFEELFSAVRNKQVLKLDYVDYQGRLFSFEVHPYFLKYYNEMWYLIGYNPEKSSYNWVLALDRIKDISPIKAEFKENQRFDFAGDYFKDIVGVTKNLDTKPVKIKIKVEENSKHFVERKPLCSSQRPVKQESDGQYYTFLTVRPNNELYNRLLMLGENIEVISPKEIRSELKRKLSETLLLYKEDYND